MNVGRPQQYDAARALEAAMQTFWSRGYGATSLQDLLLSTGLSKSSFYQAFGSKRGAFERALALYRDTLAARLDEKLAAAPSGRAFIEEFLLDALDELRADRPPRGCMIVNTATEFAGADPDIGRLVESSTKIVSSTFSAAVRRAQAEGDVAPDKDPVALGHYLLSSLSGLRTLVKARHSPRAIRSVIGVVLSALD